MTSQGPTRHRSLLIHLHCENFRSIESLRNLLVNINLLSFLKNSFIDIAWDRSVKAKAKDVCADKVKSGEKLQFST